ncbi:response regulator transcription factor [Polymorphum gilvum]|uniref:Two component transcriptional regulator, LuxR family protein n=1 Tax=Polymorphum gilvum (strain LMG 25793 / CGMCC 1.9160 / SL003B-26A1) TaxID=991905 RepID=F2J2X5_POLGS|nr:response regulator transcription factor [Polymorphum gilvum]ADZ68845.1 two component transcriptional regulator, LuxR family protein [Polymorphum gilvum SL003B-26A1]
MTNGVPERDIVLVVDDSPETLGFLTQALERSGVTVLVATSGQAALSVAERVTPDMVLMDAVMPEMDGFETCRRIKTRPALQHVPVIFMTGLSETEHVVHALESGGVDFLTKPINIDELQARIRVHLANARQVQSARIALDAAGRHLIAVSAAGLPVWSTPQTRQALDAALAQTGGETLLTARLASWLATDAPAPRAASFALDLAPGVALQMHYLGPIGPDEFLFRLTTADHPNQDETLRRHFGLTAREAEVLLWIAKGKANRDIGDILGLSPRTVNKHLEQIYAKLGVENRASAAVRAAQVLHEL